MTVGALNAGIANNVIPASATMKLSVRSLDREVRNTLETRICALVNAQAESFGVRAERDYQRNYPVLVNTLAETEFAYGVARDLVGEAKVVYPAPALTGSEGLRVYARKIAGLLSIHRQR